MRFVCALLVCLLFACAGKSTRPYPAPTAEELLAYLGGQKTRVSSLRAQTKSDARIGDERANVTVLIMAEWGGRLRFMALNPNDSMAADLAADGSEYCLIDTHANCAICGPATPESVGSLLRITLEPDDIVSVLFGGTPTLGYSNASLSWDSKRGLERLTLSGVSGSQDILLRRSQAHWDVVDAVAKDQSGAQIWRIQHKDFRAVQADDGSSVRLPSKSFFEDQNDSVLIRWQEQEINLELKEASFVLNVPPGLPLCQPKQ